MSNLGPGNVGKVLILAGIVFILAGFVVILLGRLGLFNLPGDLKFGDKNWNVYIPLTSAVLISIVLTLIFWLISLLRR